MALGPEWDGVDCKGTLGVVEMSYTLHYGHVHLSQCVIVYTQMYTFYCIQIMPQ